MAHVKILTGVIVPEDEYRTEGSATIDFATHAVTGDATGVELETIGPRGHFKSRPGKVIALREFVAQDSEDPSPHGFKIDDPEWNTECLVVKWGCEIGAEIVEMSYLTISRRSNRLLKGRIAKLEALLLSLFFG